MATELVILLLARDWHQIRPDPSGKLSNDWQHTLHTKFGQHSHCDCAFDVKLLAKKSRRK